MTNNDKACMRSIGATGDLPMDGNTQKVKIQKDRILNIIISRLSVRKEASDDIHGTFRHLLDVWIRDLKFIFMELQKLVRIVTGY